MIIEIPDDDKRIYHVYNKQQVSGTTLWSVRVW